MGFFFLLSLSSVLQLVPVTAYLTVPVLELSCDTVDFKTCFVAQTKTEHVFLCNRSGCRSYWAALLGILVLQLDFLVTQFHSSVFLFSKTECTHSIYSHYMMMLAASVSSLLLFSLTWAFSFFFLFLTSVYLYWFQQLLQIEPKDWITTLTSTGHALLIYNTVLRGNKKQ